MKLIMENWRRHLKEQDNSFICPRGMFVSVMLPPTKREIVILQTSEGPTAFYRSTGSGTAGRNTEDMWLPMGGVGQHNGDPWIMKLPSSHQRRIRVLEHWKGAGSLFRKKPVCFQGLDRISYKI